MSQSSEDITILNRLDRIEARLNAVEDSNREIALQVPALLESMIGPHVENLRAHLRAELLESLTTFEESIDSKVSMRVSTIEKALIDQSAIIAALSQRAIEAEQNFQRLIGAVERLCEQKEAASTARVSFDPAFARQLSDTFQRPPAPSGLQPDSGFRPRIVSEEEAKQDRHRKPMTRI